jgi:predicted GNAT family N-acyltransferase
LTEITIKHIDWQRGEALIRAVRHAVFVREQGIPADLEWDGCDTGCLHVLALDARGAAVGTARMQTDGHIGRMAVLKDRRGQGVGSRLLASLVGIAREMRLPSVWLTAQITALPFYLKHEFVVEGDEFSEAGIVHRRMRRVL